MSESPNRRLVPPFVSRYDDETLEIIVGTAEALQRANQFFNSRPDWYRENYGSSSIPLLHDAIQAKADTYAVARATTILNVLHPAREASRDLWTWILEQYIACETQIRTLKLRSGFLSLPDEILSIILKLASDRQYDEYEDKRAAVKDAVDSAMKLSHVCSHFRTLTLTTSGLWDRISTSMKIEAISTCLTRCGPSGVHIVMSVPTYEEAEPEDLVLLYRKLVKEKQFWRIFEITHSEDMSHMSLDCQDWDPDLKRDWEEEARGVEALLLTEFIVRYPPCVLDRDTALQDRNDEEALHFYRTWSTPKLRHMTTENFFPVPFAGAKNLVSLSIECSDTFDIVALASFLSSCEALEEFSLRAYYCGELIVSSSDTTVRKVEKRCVTTLRLEFNQFNSAFVEAFFNIVCFPNVRRIKLICIWDSYKGNDSDDGMQNRNPMQAMFPHCEVFPKLRYLKLDFSPYRPHHCVKSAHTDYPPASIPFWSLPHLEVLEFTSTSSALEPVPEGNIFPKLRELSFINCESLDMEWCMTLYERAGSLLNPGEPVKLTIPDCSWESCWAEVWRRRCEVHVDNDGSMRKEDEREANFETDS